MTGGVSIFTKIIIICAKFSAYRRLGLLQKFWGVGVW